MELRSPGCSTVVLASVPDPSSWFPRSQPGWNLGAGGLLGMHFAGSHTAALGEGHSQASAGLCLLTELVC